MFKRLSAPDVALAKKLAPWEKIKWKDDQLQSIYTDWGKYFTKNSHLNLGTQYLDAALKIRPENSKALIRRNQVKLAEGRPMEVLADAMKSKNIIGKNIHRGSCHEFDLQICDALLESNQFEEAKRFAHSNLKALNHSQMLSMQKRIAVANSVLCHVLSPSTELPLYRLKKNMIADKATKPKVVKSDCDVLSIQAKEPKILSPLGKKRHERRLIAFSQVYVPYAWKDIIFLKNIRDNPNLLVKQSIESSDFLQTLVNDRYNTVRSFTRMLHARQPIYSKQYMNTDLYRKNHQDNFFRIQYQTRRNMFSILQNIRALIKKNDLTKLTKYVTDVMDSYVAIKTHRIMPWKFEFINEVFNYLGLARINKYKIPSNLNTLGRSNLITLLGIPKNISNICNVINNNLVQIKKEKIGDTKDTFKNRISYLENRLRFATYTIERCFLYHEQAQASLDNHSFDKCCLLARKSMDEANRGHHYVWGVLSALIACKAHTVLGKVEKQKETLKEALNFAKHLKNIDLILFIDICLKINNEEIELKNYLTGTDGYVKRPQRRLISSIENSESSINTNSNIIAPEMRHE
ncbi:uncharacterized protein LOC111603428 [Drosophila hydei]|uniref:Uncharacterized protein LOC111603428 n=1 Tax=Drosophila hydei TaxID=7224 RepID=A0A6J1M932_DROHY|nr:uncharacterized protein LOC111603428 [Drosophila hydei]